VETQSRIWQLIAKDLANELGKTERLELDAFLADQPEIAAQYQILKHTALHTVGDSVPVDRKERLLDNILRAPVTVDEKDVLPENSPDDQPAVSILKPMWTRWALIAAVLSGILIGGAILKIGHAFKKTGWSIIQAKPGCRSSVTLPDGSEVVLNAGSELAYPDNFLNGRREVKLSGEAYFNIAKDANAPFVIHTKEVDVKVLGTVFNLKAYPNERKTETVLISGAVEVTIKNNEGQKILLKPNQKVTVENRQLSQVQSTQAPAIKADQGKGTNEEKPHISLSEIIENPDNHIIDETAWMENRLVFRDERFDELALRIERLYGVTLIFDNDKARSIVFSGTIKGESLAELFKILQQIKPFNYKITSQQVVIN
jgi:transmembrane sensor